MKMGLLKKNLMWGIGEHFRRYEHALRFAIGLHGVACLACEQNPPNC